MAMKFGALFDQMFQSGFNMNSKGSSGKSNSEEAKRLERRLDKLIDSLGKVEEGSKEYNKLLKQINNIEKKQKQLTQSSIGGYGGISTSMFAAPTSSPGLMDSISKFEKEIKSLTEAFENGDITYSAFIDQLAETKSEFNKNFLQVIANPDSWGEVGETVKNFATNSLTKGLTKALPKMLGPMAGIIASAFVAATIMAVNQTLELNEALVDLTRSTGGLITPAKIGVKEFGTMAGSMDSLRTVAIRANVSVGQVTEALAALADITGGNIVGSSFATASEEDLQTFAIEAARMKKIYQTDIAPAVGQLAKTLGTDIGTATTMMIDAVGEMSKAGLDPRQFAANMEQAAAAAGELHFTDGVEGMKKMAALATALGVQVNDIKKGFIEINNIQELFAKQQEMTAMGLNASSQAMSKVFALQKQGKGAEATAVQMEALIKDVQNMGGIDESGQMTAFARQALEDAGIDSEAIKTVQNLARQQQSMPGMSVEKLMNPDKMSAAEKKQFEQNQFQNMSANEAFAQGFDLLKQGFIDPFVGLLGPSVTNLAKVFFKFSTSFSKITRNITMGLSFFGSLLEGVTDAVGDSFGSLFDGISDMLDALYPVGEAFNKIISPIFKTLGKTLGYIVGGVFKIFGEGLSILANMIVAVVDFFDDMTSGIEKVIQGLEEFFSWLGVGTESPTTSNMSMDDYFNKLQSNLKVASPSTDNLSVENIVAKKTSSGSGIGANSDEIAGYKEKVNAFEPKLNLVVSNKMDMYQNITKTKITAGD